MDVRYVDDLKRHTSSLWQYVVGQWCRLAIPNPDDQTSSRWLTHPFWVAVAHASDFYTVMPIRRRVLKQAKAPEDWFIARAFLSDLTSYMAKYGVFDTAWP